MREKIDAFVGSFLCGWFISVGFEPFPFDTNDTPWITYDGGHKVWTFSAKIPAAQAATIDLDVINAALSKYYDGIAPLVPLKLQTYALTLYECPCCADTYLVISVVAV